MSGHKILTKWTNFSSPSAAGDPAIKSYVDARVAAPGLANVNAVNYQILAGDRIVVQTGTLAGALLFTLPTAASVPAGTGIIVMDSSGTITGMHTIQVDPFAGDSIGGSSADPFVRAGGESLLFVSDGVNVWYQIFFQ